MEKSGTDCGGKEYKPITVKKNSDNTRMDFITVFCIAFFTKVWYTYYITYITEIADYDDNGGTL